MMIYRYDQYCSDEIPWMGYCIFVASDKIDLSTLPGAQYSQMGNQLAESSYPFVADETLEALTHLWEMYPREFINNPQGFYIYEWEQGELDLIGRVEFAHWDITVSLVIPVNRDGEDDDIDDDLPDLGGYDNLFTDCDFG